jgi:hypothetical protein
VNLAKFRQLAMIHAMQGLIANPKCVDSMTPNEVAHKAIVVTDALVDANTVDGEREMRLKAAIAHLAKHTEGELRACVETISVHLGFGHAIDIPKLFEEVFLAKFLTSDQYGTTTILGVYSSQEAAQKALARHPGELGSIQVFPLDPIEPTVPK